MYTTTITLLFLALVHGEWVEIAQQHYKKPIRPTHNHPILATIEIPSEGEETIKVNRDYINYSKPKNNWNTGSVRKVPNVNVNGVKFESAGVNFKGSEVFNDEKYPVSKNIDVFIVNKRKPEEIKDFVNEGLKQERIPVAGNVIRVRLTKEPAASKRKPFENNNRPVEVSNLSDLEYSTAVETPTSPEYDHDITSITFIRKSNTTLSTPVKIIRAQFENTRTTKKPLKSNLNRMTEKPKPEFPANDSTGEQIQEPSTSKGNTVKRIEILRTTKQTPVDQHRNEHYRPRRPTNAPKIEKGIEEFRGEGKFGTSVYKFPNIGQIKRVQITNNSRKVTHANNSEKSRYTSTEIYEGDNFTTDNQPTPTYSLKSYKPKLTQRASTSTTEITFLAKIKAEKIRFDNRDLNGYKILNPEDIMVEEILQEDKEKKEFQVRKVASLGSVKRFRKPTLAKGISNNKESNRSGIEATRDVDNNDEVFIENEEYNEHLNKVYNRNDATSTEETPFSTTLKSKRIFAESKTPEVNTQIERYEKNPHRPIKPSQEPLPEFVTKEESFSMEENFNDDFRPTENNIKFHKGTEPSRKEQNTQKQEQGNTKQETEEDPISSDTKANTMENLIHFLKMVTDIISRNTRRGVHSKLRYLEDLRDTILANIEERLEAAFPDDTPGARHTRSAPESRGHVEFPSSESALMTISFLTFAVFLIKLVLQVIQAYKNKTMMMMPTMVAAVGRAFTQHRTQN